MIRFCDKSYSGSKGCDIQNYLVMDKTIWQKGKEYFFHHCSTDWVPVLDKEFHLVCFAYQDGEADREIRMLRELAEGVGLIGFRDLHPDCSGVIIHECNELAWYMAEYLAKEGVAVHVDGAYWEDLGVEDGCGGLGCHVYEIWAEGIQQRADGLSSGWMRSASAEFECVDEIYEANIKTGRITDADGDVDALLGRLRREKQIVIRGVGTKAHDAYDWLLSNGIDICAFQSKIENKRKYLFGKPILKKEKIGELLKEAVIIECSEKYSAWGFGDIDQYDYEGYRRNKQYLLLRDYIEVPENNLIHLLRGKELIFVGDRLLCSRVYKRLQHTIEETAGMKYWDILREYVGQSEKIQVCETGDNEMAQNRVYLLVGTKYAHPLEIKEETAEKYNAYLCGLDANHIYDYTDYFSDITKCIHLEEKMAESVRECIRVSGILIGAIPAYSGNTLIRQCMSGHPQVMMIEEYGYFNENLYSICVRLAQGDTGDIIADFRKIYQQEAAAVYLEESTFAGFDREKFYHKIEELLEAGKAITSQELFIIFHIAYMAGFGKEYSDLSKVIIYWEPHNWNRHVVKEWSYWLGCAGLKCFVLRMVRNRYIRSGSAMKRSDTRVWRNNFVMMFTPIYMREKRMEEGFEEIIIRFEDLKCRPNEMLLTLCGKIGISFDDALLNTTYHGQKVFFRGEITGFDVKPAYNLYEEYFSPFDRMRICLIQSIYQRKYNYPYVSCMEFSRRELQEMFRKDFRWEKNSEIEEKKSEFDVREIQCYITKLLWQMRFAEITGIWRDMDLD
ncbi:MAG: hypothetical protein NC489_36100, partial [Ruminococcus flavefaciens]|nr:hypothetical protein [Ruminococcus flavefaciens]